jgi:hypothetical protein
MGERDNHNGTHNDDIHGNNDHEHTYDHDSPGEHNDHCPDNHDNLAHEYDDNDHGGIHHYDNCPANDYHHPGDDNHYPIDNVDINDSDHDNHDTGNDDDSFIHHNGHNALECLNCNSTLISRTRIF